MTSLHVSVVITAFAEDRYIDVNEAIESVLLGSYRYRDVTVVVDGNYALYDRLNARWDVDDVTILLNGEILGAAASRNAAVETVNGDIVAFMDDDAVADPDWLQELVGPYEMDDAVAVGGRMAPLWIAGKPDYLPAEFYWLVGVTYRGFPDERTEVRNTFASNLSFDLETFETLGGFNTNIGPTGESLLQSAETELCARLNEVTGRGVIYNPDAVVSHKIYKHRTSPWFLLRRAFWQGVSKRGMQKFSDVEFSSESSFLHLILKLSIPERLVGSIHGPHRENLFQLVFIIVATTAVGIGYVWGFVVFAGEHQEI